MDEDKYTARNFLISAGYDDSEENLSLLSQYVGHNDNFFAQFPDAFCVTVTDEYLIDLYDEPAKFQEYYDQFHND